MRPRREGTPALPRPDGQTGGATPPQRSARVTIGRLDVQVHNHPPAPAPVPPAADLPPPDVLEQRYLSRFWLKL